MTSSGRESGARRPSVKKIGVGLAVGLYTVLAAAAAREAPETPEPGCWYE
jgi:hypothetical protein